MCQVLYHLLLWVAAELAAAISAASKAYLVQDLELLYLQNQIWTKAAVGVFVLSLVPFRFRLVSLKRPSHL